MSTFHKKRSLEKKKTAKRYFSYILKLKGPSLYFTVFSVINLILKT